MTEIDPEPPGAPPRWHAVAGLSCAVLLSLAIAIPFLPGTFIPDSLDQYDQALFDKFSNWHTPILTGLWGFLDTPPELVLVFFVTLLVVSAVVLVRAETPWSWAVAVVAVVCLWPMTLGWLTTIHKDAWFAAFFLAGAVGAVRARTAVGRPRLGWLALAAAGWWLAAAARQNAIVPVAAVLFLGWPLALPSGGERWARARAVAWAVTKRGLIAVGVSAAIFGSQLVYADVVVDPADWYVQQAVYQFDLASLSVREDRMLFPASSLKPGATLDQLRAVYQPGEGGPLFFSAETPIVYPIGTEEQLNDLRDAWSSAIKDEPLTYLRHRVRYAESLLGFREPTYGVYDRGFTPTNWRSKVTIHEPYFPSMRSWFNRMLSGVGWFADVRAWMFALVLLGVGLSRRGRRSVTVRILALAGLASEASIAAAGMTSTFRYSWFMMICSMLVAGIGTWWVVGWVRDRVRDRARDRTPDEASDRAGSSAPDTIVPSPEAATF